MNGLRILLACVVTTVWAFVYLAPYFVHDSPSPPPEVSGVMLCVVAYFFTRAAVEAVRNQKDKIKRAADAYNSEPPGGAVDDRP